MSIRHAGLALALSLCSLPPCPAQSRPITLGEALDRTLSGPSLAAQAAEVEAAQARAARESLAPPLTAGMEIENFAGSGPLQGIEGVDVTLSIGRLIELGAKRQARVAVGDAEVSRQRLLGDAARRETTMLVRQRFAELLADQERLRLAEQHVALARRSRDEVMRVVESGRNPETDLHSADLELADAELELEHAEHELAAARVTLASGWGARAPDFPSAAGALAELPAVESFEILGSRLEASPRFREAVQQTEVLAARRRLAEAGRVPDLHASLGVRRLGGLGEQALVASLSLPLGTRARASLEMRESDALSASQSHRNSASLAELHQATFEKYQELLHARSEVVLLRTRMLPASEKSLALARRGFEAGRFTYQTLVETQERWFELRRRQIDSALRYHILIAEIESIAGETPGATP